MATQARPLFRLYRSVWASLDLLFPPTCGGCEQQGARWCVKCQTQTILLKPPWCDLCGDSLLQPGVCGHCQAFPPHFSAARSWASFTGPIRQAIHRLKYKRDVSLGVVLAEPLVDLYSKLNWNCDLVLPVPLGLARLKERGYNQSDLLARPLSLAVGIPYQSTGLIRVYETRSQVGLTFSQRRENVNGAFQALPESVSGRRVLVIDDVATSSATLDACAAALIDAGSKEVFALTLARAGYQTNY